MSQAQVADSLGFKTEATVSNHERGVTTPNEDALALYAKLFGVSTSDLRYVDLSRPPSERQAVPESGALPQLTREYLAEAHLEFVRAGFTDAQVKLSLALLQSEVWLDAWRAMRGESPTRDVVLDGMKTATWLLRKAHVQASLDHLMLDSDAEPDQAALLAVMARAPREMLTPVAAVEARAASAPPVPARAPRAGRRQREA